MLARIKSYFKPETKAATSGLSNPADWLVSLFGGLPSASGVTVGPTTAMRSTAVSAAVALISNAVATLPCKVFARLPDGGKQPDPAHPAYALTHSTANPWTSAGELRRELTVDSLLYGCGFGLVVRAGGRPVEIHRLAPGSVTVDCADDGAPIYRIQLKNGDAIIRGYADVVSIRAPGGSPVTNARDAIGLSITLENHASKLFANGARPSGLLKFTGTLSPEAAQRIKESWQRAHAGGNSGGTAVLENGGDFTPLAFTSTDAQFQEARAFQVVEIARAFNVPVSMIGDLSRATWSNSLEQRKAFLTFTLLPWLRLWTDNYERVLLSDDDRETHSIDFVTADFLRADTAARAESYSKFRASGVMTANEIRALENLPPLPGGDVLESPHVQSGKSNNSGPAQ